MATAKFQFVKQSDRLALLGEYHKSTYAAYVAGLPVCQVVDGEFKRHRPAKTQAQLGYWFGVLMPFICAELRAQGHDSMGEVDMYGFKTPLETTPELIDSVMKKMYATSKQLKEPPLKRKMNTEEMASLIDFAVMWTAEKLGVIAPEPVK